jgi:hypothetical protein
MLSVSGTAEIEYAGAALALAGTWFGEGERDPTFPGSAPSRSCAGSPAFCGGGAPGGSLDEVLELPPGDYWFGVSTLADTGAPAPDAAPARAVVDVTLSFAAPPP